MYPRADKTPERERLPWGFLGEILLLDVSNKRCQARLRYSPLGNGQLIFIRFIGGRVSVRRRFGGRRWENLEDGATSEEKESLCAAFSIEETF